MVTTDLDSQSTDFWFKTAFCDFDPGQVHSLSVTQGHSDE